MKWDLTFQAAVIKSNCRVNKASVSLLVQFYLHNSVLQASSDEQLISLHTEDEVGSNWFREILYSINENS